MPETPLDTLRESFSLAGISTGSTKFLELLAHTKEQNLKV